MKSLKLGTVLPILIGLAGLVFGGYQYWQTTVPHTQFEEVKAKLDVVEKRLAQAETLPEKPVPEETLTRAKSLFSEAERAWMRHDYTVAEELLAEAHSLVPFVPTLPSAPMNLPLLGGLSTLAVVFIVIYLFAKSAFRGH